MILLVHFSLINIIQNHNISLTKVLLLPKPKAGVCTQTQCSGVKVCCPPQPPCCEAHAVYECSVMVPESYYPGRDNVAAM